MLRAMVFVSRKSPDSVSPESVSYALRIVGEGMLGTIRVRNWGPLGSRRGTTVEWGSWASFCTTCTGDNQQRFAVKFPDVAFSEDESTDSGRLMTTA